VVLGGLFSAVDQGACLLIFHNAPLSEASEVIALFFAGSAHTFSF